jgi:DNA-directed RNA polymerase specialized sigma24 family protein
MGSESRNGRPGRWELDRAAFEAILASLNSDRETASLEYERLRGRLIRFFALDNAARSHDLADIAFDRLARKIVSGESIRNVAEYLFGIARVLVLEERARLRRDARMSGQIAVPGGGNREEADLVDALELCMDQLSEESRAILYRYYSTEGRERIRMREQMAQEMGLQPNALRNRVLRLRQYLERKLQSMTPAKTWFSGLPGIPVSVSAEEE